MTNHVIVWDIETIPDLKGFAAANYLAGRTDEQIREVMGDKFPKHIYHSIVCIGALVAHWENGQWSVDAIGAPHIGERSEKELVQGFVKKIAELGPRLITFNGNSFDLPVLRYRAMVHSIPAPGLTARPYFNRYTDDAIDLCDVLSSFAPGAKATLHELCRVMGMPGKPEGIHGGEVARYCMEGRIKEVADYCETDIVNTYQLWLRYELFRGGLMPDQYQLSQKNLAEFIKERVDTKPHLKSATDQANSQSAKAENTAFVIMGEHVFEQMKAEHALKALNELRAGEAPIEGLSIDERRWLTKAFDYLKQIDAQRLKGRPNDSAYCIFNFDNAYVQFLASPDSKQLVCEAVSTQSKPEIAKIINFEKEQLLFEFGFERPSVSPNYSQKIEIESEQDLAYVARLAFRVSKEVYQGNFGSGTFKLHIPDTKQTAFVAKS